MRVTTRIVIVGAARPGYEAGNPGLAAASGKNVTEVTVGSRRHRRRRCVLSIAFRPKRSSRRRVCAPSCADDAAGLASTSVSTTRRSRRRRSITVPRYWLACSRGRHRIRSCFARRSMWFRGGRIDRRRAAHGTPPGARHTHDGKVGVPGKADVVLIATGASPGAARRGARTASES